VRARVLDASALDEAAALLLAGDVVAVPTDTVYGLAARADDDGAVASLFAAKARPTSVPIAVLAASSADARALARRWPPEAEALSTAFWPGPLTVVVEAERGLAARLGASRAAGLRVPDDRLCRALLTRTGPLAVTSANRHGAAPATSATAVLDALGEGVAAVLDGGVRDGTVSTVVDVTGSEPVVVREGAVSADAVRAALSRG